MKNPLLALRATSPQGEARKEEGVFNMKCPVCGIEMKKKTATEWVCRNPKCVKGPVKGGNK